MELQSVCFSQSNNYKNKFILDKVTIYKFYTQLKNKFMQKYTLAHTYNIHSRPN